MNQQDRSTSRSTTPFDESESEIPNQFSIKVFITQRRKKKNDVNPFANKQYFAKFSQRIKCEHSLETVSGDHSDHEMMFGKIKPKKSLILKNSHPKNIYKSSRSDNNTPSNAKRNEILESTSLYKFSRPNHFKDLSNLPQLLKKFKASVYSINKKNYQKKTNKSSIGNEQFDLSFMPKRPFPRNLNGIMNTNLFTKSNKAKYHE